MILKPRHLYKAVLKRDGELYNSYKRKYVLICPITEYKVDNFFKVDIASFVSIDIINHYSEGKSIYLTGQSFQFEKPSINDVFEIIQRMKKEGSKYRYSFKTSQIIKTE